MNILIFYASYGGGHLNAAKSINECISNYDKNKIINLSSQQERNDLFTDYFVLIIVNIMGAI